MLTLRGLPNKKIKKEKDGIVKYIKIKKESKKE